MVTFVTTYHGMHLNVFLVVDQGQAYLLCYRPETDEFGYMCPCCMLYSNRLAIMNAVNAAVAEGGVKGTILWCCHNSYVPSYGNELTPHPPLDQRFFKGGSAEGISAETKRLIREEAFRQIAAGAIKIFVSKT